MARAIAAPRFDRGRSEQHLVADELDDPAATVEDALCGQDLEVGQEGAQLTDGGGLG